MSVYEGDWKNLGTFEVFDVPQNVGLLTDVAFWKDLFRDLHLTQRKYATDLSQVANKLTEKYEEERYGGTEMNLFYQMVEELRECIEQNSRVVSAESDLYKNKLDRLTEFKSTSEKKLETLKLQCSKAEKKYKNLCKKMEKVTEKFEDQLTKLESVAKDAKTTGKACSTLKARVDALAKKYERDAYLEEKLRQDMVGKCRELETEWTDADKPKAVAVIKSIISRKSARNFRLSIDGLFQEIGNSSLRTSSIPVFKEDLLIRYEELVLRKSPGNLHDSYVHNGSGDHDGPIILDQLSSRTPLKETDLTSNSSSIVDDELDAITETKDVTKLRNVEVVALTDYCSKDKTHLRLSKGTRFVQLQPADPAFLCYGEVKRRGRRSRGLYPSHIVELAVN